MEDETEAAGDDGAGDDERDDGAGGAWAALVVLLTATALFFAAFALLYCLSSLFRPAPPTLGRASPTTTATTLPFVSPATNP